MVDLYHVRERNHNKIIVETRLIASLRDVVIMGNQPDMILFPPLCTRAKDVDVFGRGQQL